MRIIFLAKTSLSPTMVSKESMLKVALSEPGFSAQDSADIKDALAFIPNLNGKDSSSNEYSLKDAEIYQEKNLAAYWIFRIDLCQSFKSVRASYYGSKCAI